MPTIVHAFDWPDRVVVGTVGQPGSRTFYMQARAGYQIITIALEKQQSALLAEKVEEILEELMGREGNPVSIPSTTPVELVDNDPLEEIVEQFRTGSMTLGWDPTTAQIVIEAYSVDEAGDGSSTPENFVPEQMMLVRIPVGTARAFAKRTLEVVGAGRPICSLCGTPIDADGHVCPPLDDI